MAMWNTVYRELKLDVDNDIELLSSSFENPKRTK